MSDKKVCLRFKRTAAGRRCAGFGFAGVKRNKRTCVRYKRTKSGRKCARFSKKG